MAWHQYWSRSFVKSSANVLQILAEAYHNARGEVRTRNTFKVALSTGRGQATDFAGGGVMTASNIPVTKTMNSQQYKTKRSLK